jgi:ribosomal 50S subunit-recycling heat shock protein
MYRQNTSMRMRGDTFLWPVRVIHTRTSNDRSSVMMFVVELGLTREV